MHRHRNTISAMKTATRPPVRVLPEFKAEVGIPAEYVAAAPMILGYPAVEHPPVPRKTPEVYFY